MTASAIDRAGVGTNVVGASGTSQAVAYPSSWAANDYGLLCLYLDAKSTITTPTGWTALGSQDFASSARRIAVFGRKFAGGDSGTVTISWASTSSHVAQIVSYSGVHLTTPVETAITATGAISGGVATNVVWPATTNIGSRSVLFLGAHATGGFPTVSSPNLSLAHGDTDFGQACLAYDNALTTISFSAWDIARPGAGSGSHDDQTNIGIADTRPSTPTNDLGYVAVNLLPADGTLQPQVRQQPQAAYSTGIYRPLLQQPVVFSGGYQVTAVTVDGAPRMSVQVCDTTDPAKYRWLEVGDRIRNVAPGRGCEQPADRPRVGTASVTLDNRDGLLSPWATSGAFTTGSVSFMRAGTLLRFGALLTGHSTLPDGWYPWFVGRIEDVEEGTTDFKDAWVTYSVTELTAEAAADNREAGASVGANETFDVRMFRVLDSEWLYGVDLSRYSDTAIGDAIPLQATTLAGDSLNEMYLDADSTYRRVLGGTDGALWVTRMFPAAGTTARYTFSNDTVTYAGSLPIVDVVPYASRDRILNKIRAAKAGGGTNHTAGDSTSARKYGVRAEGYGFPRSDLITVNDSDLVTVIGAWATRHAYDELGIASIEVDADQDPALWGVLTDIFSQGLEQHYVIDVKWVHPSGNLFDFTAVVNGFSYSLTANGPGVAAKLVGTLSLEAFVAATA